MARKRKGRPINGILLVDKPKTVSSNYVVQRVKRIFQAAKAGHTGALDPLATGLLPVCLGEATKFSQFLLEADKRYFVTAKLGQRTDTSDADGEIVETKQVDVSETDIKQAIKYFVGNIKQVPSMFSALKFEGKPLYYYARQGINIDRPARAITIHNIEWIGLEKDELSLNVSCSKGTYIRTLIDDLGQMLGCGAHVIALRRTAVAHYEASQMISIDKLEALAQCPHPKPEVASEQDVQKVDGADTEISQEPKSSDLTVQLVENFDVIDQLLLAMDTPIQALATVKIGEQETAFFQQGRAINIEPDLDQDMQQEQVVRVYQHSNSKFLGVATVKDIPMKSNTHTFTIHPKRVVVYQ